MDWWILIIIFLVSSVIGYFLIKNVPSLLHTPLMSGTNALSGITVLGALIIAGELLEKNVIASSLVSGLAIILAMVNVVGGYFVTDRMLKKFSKKVGKR